VRIEVGDRPKALVFFAARQWAEVSCAERRKGLMETLLQVDNLKIAYGVVDSNHHQAVDGVSFRIAPGEVVGLMGESGCGKTSIAMALLGLLSMEYSSVSGRIRFRGDDLLAMDERSLQEIRGSEISMVYQEPGIALSPVMGVGLQIAEVVHAHQKWSWEKCREEAHSILTRVGLTPTNRIFAAYPHQLSGGQLQRVVLAQALVCGPALLIADEPTASLDARNQAEFIALLRDLKQQSRMSLLLVSHTPEIQASLADRLLVLKDGRVIEAGDFDQLYSNPSHPYTRALLHRHRASAIEEKLDAKRVAHENLAR
jgi:ABC-type glutathione transport system ATPase component